MVTVVFLELDGGHRDLHVQTHSFPTRRSSELDRREVLAQVVGRGGGDHPAVLELHRLAVLAVYDERVEHRIARSDEHTSELQSLMHTSYAVFCLKKTRELNPLLHC